MLADPELDFAWQIERVWQTERAQHARVQELRHQARAEELREPLHRRAAQPPRRLLRHLAPQHLRLPLRDQRAGGMARHVRSLRAPERNRPRDERLREALDGRGGRHFAGGLIDRTVRHGGRIRQALAD